MAIEGYCVKCGIEVGTDLTTKYGRPMGYKTSRAFVKVEGATVCKSCWYIYPCYDSGQDDY